MAAFLFAIQVYCDFGGYSDIARGCSKIMGVDLMVNFRSPFFFSKSMKEYWWRHHISLTKWFTAYVYIPLGGNRKGTARKYINNTITFLLSGLWHGADWTFVIWGGLQSVYLNTGDMLRRKLRRESLVVLPGPRLQNLVNTLITGSLVSFAYVFFRADSLTDAGILILAFLRDFAHPLTSVSAVLRADKFGFTGVETINFLILFCSISVLFAFDYANEKRDAIALVSGLPFLARWSLYVLIPLWILFGMQGPSGGAFIYFQF